MTFNWLAVTHLSRNHHYLLHCYTHHNLQFLIYTDEHEEPIIANMGQVDKRLLKKNIF